MDVNKSDNNKTDEEFNNKNDVVVDEVAKSDVEKPGLGVRHIQVALWCTGLLVAYAGRVNLSVAIVAMVDNSDNPNFVAYPWDEATRGLVLSSFFWGYTISQVPAGLLAHRFGPKILFLGAAIVCSITTLLMPTFASVGWELLCAMRLIQGVAQGCMYPSVHTLISKWIHPSERGFLMTFTYSGTQAGTVLMLAISGVIAASNIGWPGIFYVSGGAHAIWVVVWFFFGANSPSDYKNISATEKLYIESMPGTSLQKKIPMPWKAVFTSKPFLALLVVHCGQNWGFWTLLTEIPSYMKGALDYDIKENALLSSLPYLIMWILSLILSPLSDWLINRGFITRTAGRKIFNSIAHWIPMLALIGLGFITKENTGVAVLLLCIAVGLNAGSYVGYLINHLDLASNFAGTLMGITNGIANVFSILGPLVVGYIVTDPKDPYLWKIIFLIAAGFYFIGNLIFVIFGDATTQSWNEPITIKQEPLPVTTNDAFDSSSTTLEINELNKLK